MRYFIVVACGSCLAVAAGCGHAEVDAAAQAAQRKEAVQQAVAAQRKGASVPARTAIDKQPERVLSMPNTEQPLPELGVNASLRGRQVFPTDNAWNTPIDHLPVDERSAEYIASIGADKPLHPDFAVTYQGAAAGIPYVIVPGDQPRFPVKFQYADESDHGLYPIPPDPPIEGGSNSDGDRHVLILDRDHWKLYELGRVVQKNGLWHASTGAIFDLNSNDLRPERWTSSDAAGLPIFAGLARYDEVVEQQEIRHALRFTVKRTQRAYIHPARHWASNIKETNVPPMGLRVRLKADYDISGFPPSAQVVLTALKKYGMIVADNGGDWFITGAPDDRWPEEEIATLKRVKGSDMEVVQIGEIVR